MFPSLTFEDCLDSECMSQWGYCGTTSDYCGTGCQSGPCQGGSSPVPVASQSGSQGSNAASASFYNPAGGFGSCGNVLQDNDMAVAMPTRYMKQSCGKCILVQYQGKSIVATVADTCPGCDSLGRIDLTQGAWQKLEPDTGKGLIPVTWDFTTCNGNREAAPTPKVGALPLPAFIAVVICSGLAAVFVLFMVLLFFPSKI